MAIENNGRNTTKSRLFRLEKITGVTTTECNVLFLKRTGNTNMSVFDMRLCQLRFSLESVALCRRRSKCLILCH